MRGDSHGNLDEGTLRQLVEQAVAMKETECERFLNELHPEVRRTVRVAVATERVRIAGRAVG
jgi:hypothetical protein